LTLTAFLRQSGPVLERVEHENVRLRRRDGDDLYLKRADREEAEHESIAAAGRLLASMVRDPAARDALLARTPDAMPWTRFLPDGDRALFVDELIQTIVAAADLGNFAAVGTVVRQWKNTAEVWAQPQLLGTLSADVEPGEEVQRPAS
jgi:hypothetical protein